LRLAGACAGTASTCKVGVRLFCAPSACGRQTNIGMRVLAVAVYLSVALQAVVHSARERRTASAAEDVQPCSWSARWRLAAGLQKGSQASG